MGYFVKFKFYKTPKDEEPHKIQKYEVTNDSFTQLYGLLPQDSSCYIVRYEDSDGDLCTIDDDNSLRVALKSRPSSTSTLALRIDVRGDAKPINSVRKEKGKNRRHPRKRLSLGDFKRKVKDETDSDVSLGSDDEGSDVENDDDYVQLDDENDDKDDDSDEEYLPGKGTRKRKVGSKRAPVSSKKAKICTPKQHQPTVEAIPDNASLPDTPAANSSSTTEATEDVSDGTKARIAKLLKTAYSDGNEHEQQQALKLAKRLLEKHNLTQADIEGQFTDESLPGGTAEVTIRLVNKGVATCEPPKQFERWWDLMAGTVAKNFAVKCYITRRKGKIVFYGILKNCQTAAFAYSLAFNFTHVNQRKYSVPEGEYELQHMRGWTQASKGAYTANARRNYALGVVNGLDQKVEETLREERAEKAKRERKLLRLQYKLKTKKDKKEKDACKSDTESESDSDDVVDLCSDSNDGGEEKDVKPDVKHVKPDVKDVKPDMKDIKFDVKDVKPKIEDVKQEDVKPDVKELEEKLVKLEREEKARTALVLHSENVPDRVLQDLKKKQGIKVYKGKTFQRLKEGNQAAWRKGVKDGKDINLNQKAIKNSPGEKLKSRSK